MQIDNRAFAEIRIQSITLHPLCGEYELCISTEIHIHPRQETRQAYLHAARVEAHFNGHHMKYLGFARPRLPVLLQPQNFVATSTPSFMLPLSARQLEKLETCRDAGDIIFKLSFTAEASTERGKQEVQKDIHHPVGQSDWLKQLKNCDFKYILLIEVEAPYPEDTENSPAYFHHLKNAVDLYRKGEFTSCVTECRKVIESYGKAHFNANGWSSESFKKLAQPSRKTMPKAERETAILATIYHYTHQAAHHDNQENPPEPYIRAEAKRILTMTATALSSI